MKRLVEAFEERGNAPGTWWWFGRNLFTAADILREHWAIDKPTAVPRRNLRTAIAVHGPMLMLRACAMECWLKALYVDAGNKVAVKDRFEGPPGKQHDLVSLASNAKLALDDREIAMLAKLQRWITAGRYPIELSWQASYPPPKAKKSPTTSWSEDDEALLDDLRARLFKDDERLSSMEGGDA